MFKKKICRSCGVNLKEKYAFCPYCGNRLEQGKENFGMLGKDDFLGNDFNEFKLPMGMNMIFNSLMKNLEKQIRNTDNNAQQKKAKSAKDFGNISISISTMGDKLPIVNVNSLPTQIPRENIPAKKIKKMSDILSPENLKKFSALPKEEPKTNIRRLSNKIIYEINLPGVKSTKDISILNLEKGIELKAVSEKKAYLKSIPIAFLSLLTNFRKGKFIFEFDGREN